MKTITRKKLGALLLGVSILSGLVLSLFGVSLINYDSHSSTSRATDGFGRTEFSISWLLVTLLVTGCIGAVLLVRAREANAKA